MSNGNNIHKCIVFPTWQYWLHWVPCVLQNNAASNSGDAQTLWELRVVWINWVSVVQASSFCSDTILIVKLSKIWMPSRNTNCIIYKQIYHKQLKTLASCKQRQYAQFWRIDFCFGEIILCLSNVTKLRWNLGTHLKNVCQSLIFEIWAPSSKFGKDGKISSSVAMSLDASKYMKILLLIHAA